MFPPKKEEEEEERVSDVRHYQRVPIAYRTASGRSVAAVKRRLTQEPPSDKRQRTECRPLWFGFRRLLFSVFPQRPLADGGREGGASVPRCLRLLPLGCHGNRILA
ncbi:Hypothetical predicted protein [Podarcis lilfordi]|uniref:Uncharacterized protein n=1 Tax=Podarcis lilfordi TaxID=74358 RepID=A0AA35PLP4_9SAUR|nr:Hypothetical predicted protein [Podarcis lilfordi]